MKRRDGGGTAMALAVALLVGCGGNDDSPPQATQTPTITGTPTTTPTPDTCATIGSIANALFPTIVAAPDTTPTPGEPKAVGIVAAVTLGRPEQRCFFSYGVFPQYGASNPSGPLLDLPADQIEFEIGSNTKVFNAIVLAAAVNDNPPAQVKITLDTPVQDLVAAANVHLQQPTGTITLRHLATQTATFVDHPCNDASPYLQDDLWCFLNNWVPQYAPGQYWFYSDVGFITLAECTSYAFTQQYGNTDELIQDIILQPLAMTETVFLTEQNPHPEIRARLAAAFEATPEGRYVPTTLPPYPPDNAGSGNLTATPADMMTFLEAQMGVGGNQALQDAIDLTQQPAEISMGLAWQLAAEGWLIKNGVLGGWQTYMIVNPALKVGVMVFSNSGTGLSPNDRDMPSLDNEVDSRGRQLAEGIAEVTVGPFTWATPSPDPSCPTPFPTCSDE